MGYETHTIDVAIWTSRRASTETGREANMRTGGLRVTENGRSRKGKQEAKQGRKHENGRTNEGYTKNSSSYSKQEGKQRSKQENGQATSDSHKKEGVE